MWAAVQRFAQRFRPRPAQTISSGPTKSTTFTGGEVSGSVTLGPWDDLDDEEKFKRTRDQLQNLQTQLEQVNGRIDQERKELANATDRQHRERAELEAELREAVADSAAGNLRLETFGVFLLALGLVLQGVGIVVG